MTPRAGTSLFEVLVAFAILTLVLGALLPGKAALMLRAAKAEGALLAQDYALSRLARIEAAADPARSTADTYRDWTVGVTAAPLADPAGLLRIDVTITDASGDVLAQATGVVAAP